MSIFLPNNIKNALDDGFAFMRHLEYSIAETSEIAFSTFTQRCLLYLLATAHAASNAHFTGWTSKKYDALLILLINNSLSRSVLPKSDWILQLSHTDKYNNVHLLLVTDLLQNFQFTEKLTFALPKV